MAAGRTLPWDWHAGAIPDNVKLDETAYVETSYSFHLFHSQRPEALRIGRGASVYLATMFDVGPAGRVSVGDYALLNGARIICDAEVEIGDYALISWNVVLMDTYRLPMDPAQRMRVLEEIPLRADRHLSADVPADPIRIGRNVWIGFDACILPGVSIGEGSVVGARSVVMQNVPPFTVVAGSPARAVRELPSSPENPHGS